MPRSKTVLLPLPPRWDVGTPSGCDLRMNDKIGRDPVVLARRAHDEVSHVAHLGVWCRGLSSNRHPTITRENEKCSNEY